MFMKKKDIPLILGFEFFILDLHLDHKLYNNMCFPVLTLSKENLPFFISACEVLRIIKSNNTE